MVKAFDTTPPYPVPAGFTYLRKARHECNGITNTTYEYRHEQTGMEFVLIPEVTFLMGSNECGGEGPIHSVTLSPYLISKTQVTQGIWKKFMGTNPSDFQKGDDYPVDNVAFDHCRKFELKVGLLIPTEAQWECACRAGSTTKYYWGDADSEADKYAWYIANSGHSTHPVGQKMPNAYGLYDIVGNVWEWCDDWSDSYESGAVTNPIGAMRGSQRVVRGGCWDGNVGCLSSSWRASSAPGKGYSRGLRVCWNYLII